MTINKWKRNYALENQFLATIITIIDLEKYCQQMLARKFVENRLFPES